MSDEPDRPPRAVRTDPDGRTRSWRQLELDLGDLRTGPKSWTGEPLPLDALAGHADRAARRRAPIPVRLLGQGSWPLDRKSVV